MKLSHFIPYAEHKLGRPLSDTELEAVQTARDISDGKREGIKAMRAALEALLQHPLGSSA